MPPFSRIEVNNGKYVDDQMANGIPDGGSAGQVLAKVSNNDYDVTWVTGGGGGGITHNVLIDCGTFLAPTENVLIDCGNFI